MDDLQCTRCGAVFHPATDHKCREARAGKLTLKDIAARIDAHLKRFEADKVEGGVNWWDDGKANGTTPYYNAGARAGGTRVFVMYIAYQGATSLTKAQAVDYLLWLDGGGVGKHYMLRRMKAGR